MRHLLSLCPIALAFFGAVSGSQSKNSYGVEKTSPNGVYKVRVDVRVQEEGDLFSHFREQGKIQVFKGGEVLYTNEWNRRDNWEPTFMDSSPVVEWVSGNALRMGRDNANQSLRDELVISNNTGESIKHMGVSCGKYESFDVFELTPGTRTILSSSPRLNPDTSGDFWLGYGGETQGGRRFEGVLR